MTTGGDPVARLQGRLGYVFQDDDLLRLALLHRSFAAENELDESYERLEFLGDAVLQLAVTQYLYDTHTSLAEGQMAKVRAAVVSETALARIGRGFGVGDAVSLGRGEDLTGGRNKSSIIADVLESIIGAVYLDAGFEVAKSVVIDIWSALIDRRATEPGHRDYKTRLQERLARRGQQPRYEIREEGPEHAKTFTATVIAWGRELGSGSGTSKKRAEQSAAQAAFDHLDPAPPDGGGSS